MKSTLLKISLVVGAYIAAFAAAWVGLDIYEGLTQVMRSQSSGGIPNPRINLGIGYTKTHASP